MIDEEGASPASDLRTSPSVVTRAGKRAADRSVNGTAPHSLEAELSCLGAIMMEPAALPDVLAFVDSSDFYVPAHRHTFRAMRILHDEGRPIDAVTICNQLRELGHLDEAGGPMWIASTLANSVATSAAVKHHARIVLHKSILRRQIAAAEAAIQFARMSDDVDESLARLSDDVATLRLAKAAADDGDAVESWTFADTRQMLGSVTWLWNGWVPNGLVTMLAGNSGIGKGRFALRIAQSVLFPHVPWPDGTSQQNPVSDRVVAWVDTESTHVVNGDRVAELGLPEDRFLWPKSPRDKQNPTAEFHLDDSRDLRYLERWALRTRPALIIIDSLRGGTRGNENDSKDAMWLSRFVALAANLKCAVVITHHLNKPKEGGAPGNIVELDRVRGSTALVGFMSSVIALDKPDMTTPAIRVRVIKARVGKEPAPFGIESQGVGFVGTFCPEVPRKESVVDVVSDLLLAMLAKGPRRASDLRPEIEDAGHSWRAAERAKGKLGIVVHKAAGGWWWSLPSHRSEQEAEEALARNGAAHVERSAPDETDGPDPEPVAVTAPASPDTNAEEPAGDWWDR